MRKTFILLVGIVLFSASAAWAQTALTAGDIAFSGYISNGTVVGTDEFSFVLLKSVSAGTVINFTDNGWLSTNVFRTGETTVTWTASSALAAGQEIRISALTASLASGPGSPGTVTGSALLLGANGDQILAYQGSAASPTFITGIHMNVYSLANSDPVTTTAAAWDGAVNNNIASALPPGLVTGTNAIWIGTEGVISSEKDNARFICGSASVSTVAQIRAALNEKANWTTSDDAPGFTLPTQCGYLAPTAAEVEVSGNVVGPEGRRIARALVVLTRPNGEVLTTRTDATGAFRFPAVAVGEVVTVAVESKKFRFAGGQVVAVNDNVTNLVFISTGRQAR